MDTRMLNQLLKIALIGAMTLLAFRLLLVNRFVFFALLVLAAGYFLFDYVRRERTHRRAAKQAGTTLSGQVATRRAHVRSEIQQIREQIRDIDANIDELMEQLRDGRDLPETTRTETKRMVAAFEQQRALRVTKRDFFQLADQKLGTLERNHRLLQTLAQKREQLRNLQESNFDTIADLEELKENMRYDQTFLETIDRLSTRLLSSANVRDAEGIHRELERMTQELRDL